MLVRKTGFDPVRLWFDSKSGNPERACETECNLSTPARGIPSSHALAL